MVPWHNLLISLLFYFDMFNFGGYFVLYTGYIVMPIDSLSKLIRQGFIPIFMPTTFSTMSAVNKAPCDALAVLRFIESLAAVSALLPLNEKSLKYYFLLRTVKLTNDKLG